MVPRWLRRHGLFALLAVLAAWLLFAHLGRAYLWEDEGDTAVLARTIVHHGVPVAWDGVTFSDADYGQRETSSLVMVSHPWLQYYAVAASFALFGETPLAARLPFAIAGLATIVLVYAMLLAITGDRRAALTAALLLIFSVQFLLFSRQARNYSLNALLTCLLLWQFLRLDSWTRAVLFAVTGLLLFHTHPIGIAVVAILGMLTVSSPLFRLQRRWFWPAAAVMALDIVPWVIVSRGGYAQNAAPLADVGTMLPRLAQFAIEAASVAPLVGLVLLLLYLRLRRRHGRPLFAPGERAFAIAAVAVIGAESVVMTVTHSRDMMWVIGLHHTPAIIPLAIMLTALAIVKVSGPGLKVWVPLLLVFLLTRAGQATPWAVAADPAVERDPDDVATFHMPASTVDRFLHTAPLAYIRSIIGAHPNPGTVARISDFLTAHASPGDIVITNYSWEALYFHTGLPQGMKIARSFPIYAAARARHLPEYVFSTKGVRWIVWRRAWPAYFQEQDCERILNELVSAGMSPRLAASIPETLYENRENVHFHRFAGGRYLYPRYDHLPDVLIYRVETYDESIAHYRRDLQNHPDDRKTLAELGSALAAVHHLDEAIRVFRRAVEIAPDDGAAERNLATALLDHGDFAEATTHARRAVALRPADPVAYDLLGRTLASQGELAQAVGAFEEALKVDPAFADARDDLARVRQAIERDSVSRTHQS